MSDHSAALSLGRRDVIGAWLVCLGVAVAYFGLLDLATAP
jgi:hypothetical protein